MNYRRYGYNDIFTEEEADELVKDFPGLKKWKTPEGEGILAYDEEWEEHHSLKSSLDKKGDRAMILKEKLKENCPIEGKVTKKNCGGCQWARTQWISREGLMTVCCRYNSSS